MYDSQRSARLEPLRSGIRAEGRDAAQPDAATDGIEPRLGVAQGRCAVRDVTCERAEPGGRLAEALDLELRERRIRLGGREMAHQPNHVARRRRELGEPPPAHPGVELEMDPHAFRDATVGGDQLEPRDVRLTDLPLRHGAEHDDARVPKGGAKVERFRQCRDAEGGGTRLEGRPRHVDRAVPVALRLHDGPQLCPLGRSEQGLGVSPYRSEVEGEARPLHVAILY